MVSIGWCATKKGGLSMAEPNQNLANAYTKKAEEALESMSAKIVKDWKISTAYYTLYFSLYAIMMRIGIKCEIHSCTIEFAKQFLGDYFNDEEIGFLADSLKARIDSQYYVDRTVPDEQYREMIRTAPRFLAKCKDILIKMNEKSIKEVRDRFRGAL